MFDIWIAGDIHILIVEPARPDEMPDIGDRVGFETNIRTPFEAEVECLVEPFGAGPKERLGAGVIALDTVFQMTERRQAGPECRLAMQRPLINLELIQRVGGIYMSLPVFLAR